MALPIFIRDFIAIQPSHLFMYYQRCFVNADKTE